MARRSKQPDPPLRGSVFVTGGAGLLGVNWATAIRDRHAVTLGLHDRIVSLPGVRTRHTSLESVEQLASALEEMRCELVVHTAGMTSVEACEADPDRARHVNVRLATNVAQACAETG